MSMDIYGIRDSANVLVRKKSDKKPLIYADYATDIKNDWKTKQVYAKSKSTKAIRWDSEKESTIKMTMEIFDLKWLSMLTGSDFATGKTEMLKREVLTVGVGNTAELISEPKVGSLSLFILKEDGLTHDKELTVGETATVEGTYAIVTKAITFNETTCPEGSRVVAYYMVDTAETAQTMTIKANAFPYAVDIFMDSMIRDTDQQDKFVQLHYLNAKAKGDFTLTLSADNVTKLEIEFDLLKDGRSDDMATYKIIG